MSLRLTADLVRSTGTWVQDNPLDAFRPTPTQLAFLTDTRTRRQLRGPNQAGKTRALAVALLSMMLRLDCWPGITTTHLADPFEVWVVCGSWDAYKTVCAKIWEMLPKNQVHPGTHYNERLGFSGHSFQVRNGNLCRFKTQRQQSDGGLESGTIAAAFVDEPCTEAAYSSLASRVNQLGGPILLFYTPVNAPVGWLKTRVEKGEIADHHFRLRPADVTPVGHRIAFKSGAKIQQLITDTPPALRAQKIDGEYEGAAEGRKLWAFDQELHVRATDPPAGWKVSVGFDYGLQPGKMAAVLVATMGGYTAEPAICFMDEAVPQDDEQWTVNDMADATRRMLIRNNLRYQDVDLWFGDRGVMSKATGRTITNKHMSGALARAFTLPPGTTKWIAMPPKGPGSEDACLGLLNDALKAGRCWFRPACRKLTSWARYYEGDPYDPLKDVGDGGRYAVMGVVDMRRWRYGTPTREEAA